MLKGVFNIRITVIFYSLSEMVMIYSFQYCYYPSQVVKWAIYTDTNYDLFTALWIIILQFTRQELKW